MVVGLNISKQGTNASGIEMFVAFMLVTPSTVEHV